MHLPRMYQDHKHIITRYVSQPCTKSCTKPSTCTIPSINYLPQPVPQLVYQPCTNTCTMYLNHQPCTSTPYQVPILYHIMYQPCTSTVYINTCTIPCINHVHQQCTSTPIPYHVPTMYLNHIPYHSTMPYTIYHRIYQAGTINGVSQPSTNITKRCISYMCFHIPSVFLNNVSISMISL
jgi:hypothetical protein